MAALDPDNCIKLFKLDDSRDSDLEPETVAIIPAQKNMFQAMFHPENRDGFPPPPAENLAASFPEDGADLLIEIRIELEELFRHCGDISGIADVLWEDISRRLFDRGFNVSGKQCADKWDALYSDYVEVARSDNESRISRSKHFPILEDFFKLRSKHIDSKILEDITEFLIARYDYPAAPKHAAIKDNDKSGQLSRRSLTREEFSNLSNEDDSQMLVDAINAAQKILDDNLKEEVEDRQTNKDRQTNTADFFPLGKEAEFLVNSAQPAEAPPSHLVFIRSERQDFHWDTDSTQCFTDLRLYAESSKETKRRILRHYGSIVSFLIHKMLLNGYKVSEEDCRKKWAVLMRYYNQDVRKIRQAGGDRKAVRKSFWEIDKVLRKYASATGAERLGFEWSDESVRKLIGVRIPMENAFAMFDRYIILWQYVASQMAKFGFLPTYNECSIKWMELCESYKLCLETLRRRGNNIEVNWAFYRDMRQGYEQNNKNTEAIVDCRCDAGACIESEDQSTENSTFAVSLSETFNDTDVEGLRSVGGTSDEKISSNDSQETEESVDSVSQEESIVSDKTEALDSTEFEEILEVRKETVETLSLKAGLNRFESQDIEASDSLARWNEESTFLLINLKLSRELKFRNPTIVETELWKEIATDMQSAGHNVGHQACAERWYQVKMAYEKSVSYKTGETVPPKYQAHLELTKVLLAKDLKRTKARETKGNKKGVNSVKFVWTEEAVRTLIRLRFSEKMKDLKKYGAPIAAIMRADGYLTIAPTDVSRKWSRMISTYRKASHRYEKGGKIKWQYFEMLDSYMKGLPDPEESREQKIQMAIWTPEATKKLIDIKLSLDKSCCESDLRASSSVWEKVAAAMKAEGFPVTSYNCVTEWNFLIRAHKKTKKELCNGNGAVIGRYFIIVDEAINKVPRLEVSKRVNTEEPLDFSIAGKKRKLNEEFVAVKRTRIEKPDHREVDIDENVVHLNQKVTEYPSSYCPTEIAENSGTESTENSPILKSMLDNGIGQNPEPCGVSVSTNGENCAADEIDEIIDHIDSSKENEAGFAETENRDKPVGKKEDTQSRILCDQNDYSENILIQDKAVNSTKNIEVEERNGRWSEATTYLLIDLKAQHNKQFPSLPRPNIQWDKVAALLGRLGYNYTSTECSRRWYFLKTIYEQKIADLFADRVIQPWPYFDRLDAIYKKLEGRYNGLKSILPKKRACDEEADQLSSPKKFIVSMVPAGTQVIPIFELSNTSEMDIDLKKIITERLA